MDGKNAKGNKGLAADQNKVISFRLPKEKFDELCQLVIESGVGAASIARAGLYLEMERMKAARKAA